VDPEQFLGALLDALEAEQLPYLLVGSFSSNFYGIARSTQDIDLVVDWRDKSVLCLIPHLGDEFRVDPQLTFEGVTGTRRNKISCGSTSFEIELFHLSDDPHDQMRFQRRMRIELSGRSVYLPIPEDVIITKLRWFRHKDQLDLQNVIDVTGKKLDWDYIDSWTDRHGTQQRLAQIRDSLDES
jgi:hypothetical protein